VKTGQHGRKTGSSAAQQATATQPRRAAYGCTGTNSAMVQIHMQICKSETSLDLTIKVVQSARVGEELIITLTYILSPFSLKINTKNCLRFTFVDARASAQTQSRFCNVSVCLWSVRCFEFYFVILFCFYRYRVAQYQQAIAWKDFAEICVECDATCYFITVEITRT